MKVLVCGIGSIGQRHFKNLRALGHQLAIFRSRRTSNPFIENFLMQQKKSGKPIRVFFNLKKALRIFNPDAVFVTNPSSQHIKTALVAARHGCHIFIEKPISHNLSGLDELQKIAKQKKLKVMVGYNFRFHPLLRRMKQMLDKGSIGLPLATNAVVGENVADWHPWEDYRQSYAVNKSGGGGAILCFSHDIDYLYWFLGMPKIIAAAGGKLTPLSGDTEDMVKTLLEFPKGVIASLHLDFWQRPHVHWFELLGTKGKLGLDYEAGTLTWWVHNSKKKRVFKTPANFERNTMFIDEAKHFIKAVKNNHQPLITFKQGIDVLRIALWVKKALR